MHRFMLILVACLCGCENRGDSPPTAPRPATATTRTRPALRPIEMRFEIYLARLDHRITVSPDGILRSVETVNKSYGPNDLDPARQRIEVREGRLTAEQMAELTRLLMGWDSLSSQPYGGVPDGGDVTIRYGDKTVSGGSEVPRQVTAVRIRLRQLARSMPVVTP